MDIQSILSSSEVLYRNFNTIYLYKRSLIVKHFAETWKLEREVSVNKELSQKGYPYIQEIVDVSPPYVIFKFIDEMTFGERVSNSTISVSQLLDTIHCLPDEVSNLHTSQDDEKSKRKMFSKIRDLFANGMLTSSEAELAERIVFNYSAYESRFVHGDFRPDNIIGTTNIRCFIDWELSGKGDFNRDLAYLCVGSLMRNRKYFLKLLQEVRKCNGFIEDAFTFFVLYIHLACLDNPRIDKKSVIRGVAEILKSAG